MDFLKHNLTLKILAGLCAVLLWIFVANIGFKVDYLEKEIPIKTYNIREDLALAQSLGKVKLKVRAPQNLWPRLSEDNIEAYVDLKTYDQGEYEIEVKISSQDPKIQVLEKEPKKVKVILEFKTTVKKEVALEITGAPGADYEIKETKIEPKEIEINGAKSLLEKIAKVALPLELKGEISEIQKELSPKIYDENDNEITEILFSPQIFKATVNFQKSTGGKNVEVRVKTKGQLPSGFEIEKIEVSPQSVNIFGPQTTINEINFLETKEVDLADINASKEINVGLALPPEISANPMSVTVKIILASRLATKSFATPIVVKNLDQKLNAILTPESLLLIIEGENELLNSLTSQSFRAEIDLKGKRVGQHRLKITKEDITLPKNTTLKDYEPKEIEVNITEK
jgi:YbbR domain-containing protein